MSAAKKKTSRDRQAELTKQRIYDKGLALFSERGFDETSISEICREAECSVGAFYHYFPSKESILDETFRRADEDFSVWDDSRTLGLSGRDVVIEYMRAYAELVLSTGLEFAKRFYTWKNKTFIKKNRSMQTRLVELINTEIEAGILALAVTPEQAVDWLFVCARGVVFHWCLYEGDFDLQAEICTAADRALRGVEII